MVTATLELDFKTRAEPAIVRRPLAWRGFRVERVVLASDDPYEFRAFGDACYLAYHEMTLRDGELKLDGLPTINRTELRDTLTFAPRHCSIEGWAVPAPGRNSYTALYFEPENLSEELTARYDGTRVAPRAYVRSPRLAATMTKLRDLAAGDEADPLYAEALCLTAAIETLGLGQAEASGPLSSRQLARIEDYVAAHQHEAITLDDLASLAGLSRSHFSRAFKASTGEGPYRFVSNRRIRRAQELLTAKPDAPIESVARAVGFASASAFRRVFQQITGQSPQQYRKDRH